MDLLAETTHQQNQAFALVDNQLAILIHNKTLHEWSREENINLVGRRLAEIFPELLEAQATLQQLAQTQTGIFTLSRIYRPPLDGVEAARPFGHYLDLHIEPLPASNHSLLVIVNEVTREVWLEAQLQQERKERQLTLIKHQQLEAALQSVHVEVEKQAAERLEELTRANQLILALSQVAARLEKAPNPDQVMETLGSELKQLGVTSLITLRNKSDEALVVEYTSVEPQILPLIEKLTGLRIQGFPFSRDRFSFYAELVDDKRPLFLPDVLVIATPSLLNLSNFQIEQVLDLAGIPRGTPGLSLPLLVEEQVLGVLLVFGPELRQEDIPIFSVFAGQVAIAFENARLIAALHEDIIQRKAAEEELEQRVVERTTELYTANQELQREIAERKQVEALLYQNAFYDSLTNLANRARLIEYLERAFEQAEEEPGYVFALLFIDLDRFKIINDSLGHLAGDHLLTTIARRLQANIRSEDLVARLGGDEFAIVLDGLKSNAEAQHLAERIQHDIAQPIEIDGQEVFTTASIGITLYNPAYEFPKDLLRDADAAMYRAKTLGRARYQLFEPEMHTQAVNQLALEAELRRAIERQEFILYYQPIVAIETGQITAIEALLRWQHPQRGLILPLEFLSVAEETGLIIPLGAWILRTACSQARAWHQAGHSSLRIAVNMSVYQLQHPNLPAMLQEILTETSLFPHQLELEISESAALRNIKSSPQILHKLTSLGVQIVIDDFGTGYSWLSHLRYLPTNKLKIGQDFIRYVTTHSKEREIVTAMLAVAQRMGTKVVAEGVETSAQLDFLQKHQCHEAQGYFFYPPLPVEELTRLLQLGVEEEGLS